MNDRATVLQCLNLCRNVSCQPRDDPQLRSEGRLAFLDVLGLGDAGAYLGLVALVGP